MTNDTDAPATGLGRMRPGELGRWWAAGLRSATFRAPRADDLAPTPAALATLMITAFAANVAVQRALVPGPASFHAGGLHYGWFGSIVTLWLCWIVSRGQTDAPARAARLFGVLLAQNPVFVVLMLILAGPLVHDPQTWMPRLGPTGMTLVAYLPIGWSVLAQAVLLGRAAAPRWRLAALAALLTVASSAAFMHTASVRIWYPDAPSDQATDDAPRLRVTQELMERQPRLLTESLRALAPQRPGHIDVYALTFAPFAEEDVFRRESRLVAELMQQRFDAAGRTLQLVNHAAEAERLPWATPLNLQRGIAAIAQRMDREQDVLFIHLTSHGARDGQLAASFWPIEVEPVTPAQLRVWLDAAGIRHRVISVSACYSGSWLAPLADEHTLVMTAADAEHTSYGCGRGSELTFFGRAMYAEELRRTRSFEQAHARARDVIRQREVDAGKDDGYSNPQLILGAALRPVLQRLEAQLGAQVGAQVGAQDAAVAASSPR
jgi:hypothetical protein